MFSVIPSVAFFRREATVRSFKAPLTYCLCATMDNKKIDRAVVRILDDEENLTVTLTIDDRIRTLNRPKNEALSRSLQRLKLSLFPNKKRVRQKDQQDVEVSNGMTDITVALYSSESKKNVIDECLSNEEAWMTGKWLVAGNREYAVLTNPPTVTSLTLNEIALVGHPLLPLHQVQFAEASESLWRWYRKPENESWMQLETTSRVYEPTVEDTGCKIGVECIPVSKMQPTSETANERMGDPHFVEGGIVLSAPAQSSGDGRHELTSVPAESPFFRMVTYNLLADTYVTRPNAVNGVLSYCFQEDLDMERRKQLILKEVLGYNADIVCFQECDKTVFDTYYHPHMELNGFQCIFMQKSGVTREGEAMFIRASRFEIVDTFCLVMNNLMDGALPSYLKPFTKMISTCPNMSAALKAVVTIGQMVLVKPLRENEKPLCIINTHLISKSYGEHIRMIHVISMLHEAKAFIRSKNIDAQVIFAGDFNSGIDHATGQSDGAVSLLRDGCLTADHWEWENCRNFNWKKMTGEDDLSVLHERVKEGEEDPVEGIDVELPYRLHPAIDLRTPFTTYTGDFQGLLDYIWYQSTWIEFQRNIPLPTLERLHGPIPSDVYPSDHLAVVADLKFKTESNKTTSDSGVVLDASLENIDRGVDKLKEGKIIGVPTDTLYGLAGDASNEEAIAALYAIKGRSLNVPLAVCSGNIDAIGEFCITDHLPSGLLHDLLPGPVTLVLKRKETSILSSELNPDLKSIGVRVPDSEFIRELCRQFGGPIALTSANRSGEPSSVRISDFENLWSACGIVFDGGEISSSTQGSTVVDLTQARKFKILRKGDGLETVLELMNRFAQKRMDDT